MNRKTFLKLSAAGVAGASLPLFAIGKPPSSRKVRLGLIGCGLRMGCSINYGLVNNVCGPDEEIVCIVDPDPAYWNRMRGLVKHHKPDCDVSKIKAFYDYREMLDKMASELDAVMIATPNHHHALPAILAMSKGLHVYVEKPMALNVAEVKAMRAAAKKYGVCTQVGNHGHSGEATRRFVEYVQSGALGQIREVWAFNDRLNAMMYRPPKAEPPKGMDWDLWCGPAPLCDYYAPTKDHGAMHPHDWHSWIGYGNGSIGNMGTHVLDAPFWALRLGDVHPTSVEAKDVQWGAAGSWSWRTELQWEFPARNGMDPVTLHWFDGVKDGIPYDSVHVDHIGVCKERAFQNLPPIVAELEKKYGQNLGNVASIVVGEKGIAAVGPFGTSLQFVPNSLQRNLPKPPKTIPRERGMNHQRDWLRAIANPNRPAGCNFEYSAPLAETVLLGNVAALAGKKRLEWDGEKITNAPEANKFLSSAARSGWELPKIS